MAVARCEIHGAYTASETLLMGRKLLTSCPACANDALAKTRTQGAVKKFRELVKTVAGLPLRYQRFRFDNLPVTNEPQENMRNRLLRFVERFAARDESWPAFMIFSVGEQNAPMASALLNELAEKGFPTGYVMAQDFIMQVRATWGSGGHETEIGLMERYVHPDCLVIDGIDMVRITADSILQLSTLLDKRYKALKPTVILTRGDLFTVTERLNDHMSAIMADSRQALMYDLFRK